MRSEALPGAASLSTVDPGSEDDLLPSLDELFGHLEGVST
jgi:hypothetical protein